MVLDKIFKYQSDLEIRFCKVQPHAALSSAENGTIRNHQKGQTMARKSEESNEERFVTGSSPKKDKPSLASHRGFLILLLGLVFLSATCVGLWTLFTIQGIREAELSETLTESCSESARGFDTFIRHQENRIGLLKNAITDLLSTSEENAAFSLADFLESEMPLFLKSTVAGCEEIDAIFLHLNPEANSVYHDITYVKDTELTVKRVPPLAEEEYDPNNPGMVWFYKPLAGKAPFWSEVFYLDSLENHYISYSAPIYQNGQPIAVIGLFINLRRLLEKIEQFTDSDHSFGFLLNQDLRVLYHPDYGKGILFEQLEAIDPAVYDGILSETSVLSRVVLQEDKFLALSKLSNGWVLGFDISFREIRLPVQALTVFSAGIALILLCFALLFAYLYRRQFLKPISQLTSVVTRYRRGDSEARYLSHPEGAIGHLGTSFNELANELEKRMDTIHRQNDDISAVNEELEAMNQQLEESYHVTEELATGLRKTIALASRSSLKTFESQHSFLKESLDTLMTLIPKADYGTIYSATQKAFSIASFVGHRFSRYYQIPRELLEPSENPFLINNTLGLPEKSEELKRFLPELYLRERKPIEQTLGVYLQVAGEVYGLITLDIAEGRHQTFSEQQIEIISSFANVVSSFLAIRTFVRQSEGFQKEIIFSFIKILELYDPYTQGHSEGVALLSSAIAEEICTDSEEVKKTYWTGLVHDIGKILVPSDILKKSGALSSDEYNIIQKHPQWGAEVLHSSEKLREIADLVLFHHERWDGTGYPIGLKGEEIPYISRIITIADALEAMTSDRPYRKGMGVDLAFKELEDGAGSQFDPVLVKKIMNLSVCREKILSIIRSKVHHGE